MQAHCSHYAIKFHIGDNCILIAFQNNEWSICAFSYLLTLTRIIDGQVRMKAVCVLESILRKKEDDHFLIVASYFTENKDVVLRCSESPQTSLREKANKVNILGNPLFYF